VPAAVPEGGEIVTCHDSWSALAAVENCSVEGEVETQPGGIAPVTLTVAEKAPLP